MEKLTTLGSDRWPELIKVLNDQAGQRHVQLWFASDKSQPEIQRLGVSGDLVFGGGPDFLYEVESNFSGNKANYFLKRSYTLTLTRSQSGLHHELAEDLFRLRLRKSTGQLDNPMRLRHLRRDIARLKSIQHDRARHGTGEQ